MLQSISNISSPLGNSILFVISMVLAFYVLDIDTMIIFLIGTILLSLFLTIFGFSKRLGFKYFITAFFPVLCLLILAFLFFTLPGWVILGELGFGIPAPLPN
ncbi:hypothetical protein [Aequorivita xiaoshiensis]|uniref:Uncharacterized protein n=1 Tax=Aequorivita xiaoshiensis TaxID=2874476 RepID=A0A9X1R4M3_9FLAO|nr:hypothetical protein [Aequorivita xiaoshiensis]MCG2432199.1 hypothetical protein [Aequorivita xiaoshiensis]